MAKIVSMSVGAIDPIAQTKRVFYRPTDTTIVLSAGDAVCYKNDAQDHKARGAGSTPVDDHLGGAGTVYAEGSQTYTGRLFCVEEPLIDNIDQFAGIVKSLGPKAGADGDMIEIFKANSGAVVPCNIAAMTTVVGRTLLAIKVGTRVLGNPEEDVPDYGDTTGSSDTKIVGVAMEVRTTAGKCWVKLDENQFMHQGGQLAYEYQVAAGTVDVTVNRSNINFLQTSGNTQALHMRALLSGTGQAKQGVYRFDVNVTGIQTGTVYGAAIQFDVGSDETQTAHMAALRVCFRTKGYNPNLSGCNYISLVDYEWAMTSETNDEALDHPPTLRPWFRFMSFYAEPTHLLYANDIATLGGKQVVANVAVLSTEDLCIPVRIGGNTYNIIAFADQCDA